MPAPDAEHPFPRRIRAPSLEGGLAWINTAGPLEIEQLRGKFVLLDFWTYCCINCMHVLPELKKLEAAYPHQLVVIGVHSAKFEAEEDSKNITDAVLRYEIEHPVVNDARHEIWNRYAVNSWPSLRLIDPEGNLVAGHSGEITFEDIKPLFEQVIPYYRKKGVLDETPLRFDLAAYQSTSTPLRYPGKVLADEPGNRLFIADSNHNRLVIARLDGTLLEVIGSGVQGAADGDFASATFNKPQGMVLHGQTLYVADTENHLLRKVDLAAKTVATVAGQGRQGRNAWPGLQTFDLQGGLTPKMPDRWVGKPRETSINSPWDLWVHGDDLYIAMAGPHQIWKMPLDESELGPYAGNGREDIVDGPLLPRAPYDEGYASFAQPSGLASDGKWLFVADSEGSSIRAVPFDSKQEVKTIIGTSHLDEGRLFAFGDVDGDGFTPRLQHALGVAFYEGKLYVADTYNNKIKVVDVDKCSSHTLAGTGRPGRDDALGTFDEPAGITAAAGKLYVADTNNHLIRTVDLRDNNRVATLEIKGLAAPKLPDAPPPVSLAGAKQVELPSAVVQAIDGAVRLKVQLQLPEGYKINPLAPLRYQVESAAETGPLDRAGFGRSVKVVPPSAAFEIKLPAAASGEDTLRVSVNYYYCQDGAEGLCKAGSAVWTLPLKLAADGAAEVLLPLKVP